MPKVRIVFKRERLHVSQLDARQLLRLSTWFKAKGEDMVTEMSKTAGTLTPEQEEVANKPDEE